MISLRHIYEPYRQFAGAVAVALLSALQWYVWMSWDTGYQTDPVTGEVSGPYEAWQVAGCALSLLVVFVGALLFGIRPLWASTALTLAFTAAWTATAAADDETGMYGVGTIMLLFGLAAATAAVSLVFIGIRRLRPPPPPPICIVTGPVNPPSAPSGSGQRLLGPRGQGGDQVGGGGHVGDEVDGLAGPDR
jgi:hypothetical protein